MTSSARAPWWLALSFVIGGCSAVLPLGDEYTFGNAPDAGTDAGRDGGDGSTPEPDASRDDAGTDAGCDVPTMDEVCTDRCGSISVCGQTFTCGTCPGELSCSGGGTANVCGCAEPPCALSTASFGDASVQQIRGLAVDFEGNVFVAGNFRGRITFGGTTHINAGSGSRDDIFLVKFDRAGNVLWSRSFGGAADATTDRDQQVRGLAVDGAGNVILAAEGSGIVNFGGANLENDILVAKFGRDGEHVWSAAYGTEFSSYPTSIAVDPGTYDVVMTGSFWGTLRFGSLVAMTAVGTQAYYDMFMVRLRAADGVPQSARRFGDEFEQQAESVAVSGSHSYLAATFYGTLDFGPPNPTPLTSTTFYSLAIARLTNATFFHSWSRRYGSEVWSPRLATDADGNVVVSTGFSGSLDISTPALMTTGSASAVAKLDTTGATQWARQIENADIDALAVGSDGSVYIAGSISGNTDLGAGPLVFDGTQDAFIAHLSATGDHLFSRVFSSSTNQRAGGIGASSDGAVWAAFDIQGAIDLGTGELRSAGASDVAVGRYVP